MLHWPVHMNHKSYYPGISEVTHLLTLERLPYSWFSHMIMLKYAGLICLQCHLQ